MLFPLIFDGATGGTNGTAPGQTFVDERYNHPVMQSTDALVECVTE